MTVIGIADAPSARTIADWPAAGDNRGTREETPMSEERWPAGPDPACAIGLARVNRGLLQLASEYHTKVTEGIMAAARRLRHDLVVFHGHSSNTVERSLPIYRRQCDGLLHFFPELTDESYTAIRAAGIPQVTIGGTVPAGDAASVDIDDVAAAREITRHLLDLGHRRIAMIMGNGIATVQRLEGFRIAHSDGGLRHDDSLVIACVPPDYPSYLSGTLGTQMLMRLPPDRRPTAVVCFNDVVALGALRAASDLRIAVPGSLSVVGFDDILEARMYRPGLTTIRQPMPVIGERAVELLLDILRGAKPSSFHEIVPYEMVVRGSTAPPPSSAE